MFHRPNLDAITPYTPGRAIQDVVREFGVKNPIKLASNENPFGCPLSAAELSEVITSAQLYPHQPSSRLFETLSQRLGCSADNLIFGNGSDEILQMLGLAFLNPTDEVLSSEHTFSEYEFVAKLMGVPFKTVPMNNFRYDLPGFLAAITPATKLIFIANPNNPTGTCISHDELAQFLAKVPEQVLVVVDEAYAEFVTDPTFPRSVELQNQFPNLVITRTFSKLFGLAGFRLGYAVASAKVLTWLKRVQQPFNVGSIALKAGELALEKAGFIEKTLNNNQSELKRFQAELPELGFSILPTQANFICALGTQDAKPLVEWLMTQGLIIRHLGSFGLPNAIRITIGLPEQNERCLSLIRRRV
ncbi:MAG: histidinol-phosphate transaminase [Candidatus Margulisiibacteriota bacterium]